MTTTTLPTADTYRTRPYVWHEDEDGRAYARTDDPRLLAVTERDESPLPPDGDAYAPAYWAEYRGAWDLNRAGSTFDDDEAREAVERAWGMWGRSDTAARYLSIFHGVTVHELAGPSQGDLLVILDTPAHREALGTPDTLTTDEHTAGDRETWTAHLDGDVHGIGYAYNIDAVAPLDPEDDATPNPWEADGWTVELESWGYAGEEWARHAAADLDGAPTPAAMDASRAAADAAAAREADRAAAVAALPGLVEEYAEHVADWDRIVQAAAAELDDEPTDNEHARHDV